MYKLALVVFVFLLSSCSTYYDPNDPYMRGVRFFDRKNYEAAKQYFEPLANASDCDAQYRYGTLYFLGAGVPENFQTAKKWRQRQELKISSNR